MASEKLKIGFTTGAAAAAATKAALLYLIDNSSKTEPILNKEALSNREILSNKEILSEPKQNSIEQVSIRCLNNEWILIPIHSITRLSDNSAEAVVIKDAGDDPDVTHKAEIGARVSLSKSFDKNENKAETENIDSENHINISNITIRGGQGVGVVTKAGLEVDIGNPAINSGPKKMICEAVNTVLMDYRVLIDYGVLLENDLQKRDKISTKYKLIPTKYKFFVDVEIFVPKGEELAKKTLNSRLGILGGISILGTTGIVKPMSHEAYIATIKSGISVALATKNCAKDILDNKVDNKNSRINNCTLVFTTGRRSEKVAISLFPELPEEAFIQIGDFFKASIDAAITSNVKSNFIVANTKPNTVNIEDSNLHRVLNIIENNNLKPIEIIIVVFFGKAVKMAMGFPHTHAAKSELALNTIAEWAKNITNNDKLVNQILNSNTARHAFNYIYPDYPQLIAYVGNKIVESAYSFANELGDSNISCEVGDSNILCGFVDSNISGQLSYNNISERSLKIRAIILDFEGNKIFDSKYFDRCF
ncbi:MAG: cobalt-precorrin-5B (C(1))-methyltransferase [Desulfamplus sp.]|nr:cobalt-precorrin-5B (C(1))-methyltransferase [Desulfamplus sp.]